MTQSPSAVLFDCDGVLVDSEKISNDVMRESLARHGLTLELHEIMALFVGGTMEGCFHEARRRGATIPDSWIDDINEAMFARLASGVLPVAGVVAVLDHLDEAGVRYAVASNGPHAKMEVTLSKTGLLSRLRGRIVSREDVPNPKPAPDVYLRAAALLGVDPEDCVVVEDSVNGAMAGRAAGMRTLGYAEDTPVDRLAPICDATFDHMVDLPALIGLE